MEIMGYSKFSKDENIEYKDLMFKVQKQIDASRDRQLYIINESQLASAEKPVIRFDTYYFDDEIKLDVFHKNSSIKTNMTGKGIIHMNSVSLDKDSIVAVPIYNKKL